MCKNILPGCSYIKGGCGGLPKGRSGKLTFYFYWYLLFIVGFICVEITRAGDDESFRFEGRRLFRLLLAAEDMQIRL